MNKSTSSTLMMKSAAYRSKRNAPAIACSILLEERSYNCMIYTLLTELLSAATTATTSECIFFSQPVLVHYSGTTMWTIE